ncbi:type III pantothenate kinase [Stutzerimonas azotifigens]|uniref:type III pantothenate kinase n=1 Tax=Stutzerimonas azotifigens TaxID=291995 RepID=UPI000483094C|nr:type III pantothenate kinase [Stutzerimonas azotifigens]
MILELDCGNSFLKWRLWDSRKQAVSLRGRASDLDELVGQLATQPYPIARCRMVSVRGVEETSALVARLEMVTGVAPVLARSTMVLAGVSNGYAEYERLGVDRWLAVVAAYNRVRSPCVVIDVGTAVTVDYVQGSGVHIGGYIAPGLPLLRKLLTDNTGGVRYQAVEQTRAARSVPGVRTADAVERGCELMVRDFVSARIVAAEALLGKEVVILMTGGDAALAEGFAQVQFVEDLVFEGLAIACP